MKIIFILLCFLLILSPLYSDEGENAFEVSLGVLGVGTDSSTYNSSGYYYARLVNLMYQLENGFGITLSPFVFFMGIKDFDNYSLTFLNVSLFYNFFKENRSFFILGPFVSANYINPDNIHYFNFRSGLTFSIRNILHNIYYSDNSIFNSDLFNIELGYEYNNIGKHKFFIQTSIDLLAVFVFIAWGSNGENAVKKHQEQERLR